jgi:hypothetical protein
VQCVDGNSFTVKLWSDVNWATCCVTSSRVKQESEGRMEEEGEGTAGGSMRHSWTGSEAWWLG